MPAYVCDAVLHPLRRLHIDPIFYTVDQNLMPLWDELERLVTTKTRAIIAVHYFGVVRGVERFQSFAAKHNIFLIEDNANGFASTHKGKLAGIFGDIGVVSPWKSLPILNGSLLFAKDKQFDIAPGVLMPANPFLLQMRSLGAQMVKRFAPARRIVFRRHGYDSLEGQASSMVSDWAMDAYSYDVIQKTDLEGFVGKRQAIYAIWKEWTENQGLRPVITDDLEGSAPHVYPAYAESVQVRNRWFRWGLSRGIDVHSWPTLPVEVRYEGSSAMRTWEHVVCFPIHALMNPSKIEKMLRRLPSAT